MAMTGLSRLCTSSTSATDFSRPTSNGATAPGNSTAFRIGNTASSSPNLMSSSDGGGGGGDCGCCCFFLSLIEPHSWHRDHETGKPNETNHAHLRHNPP